MVVGFAITIPTLIEERFASNIAEEFLTKEMPEYDFNRDGLDKAFGTYIGQSLTSALGGDILGRIGKARTAFR